MRKEYIVNEPSKYIYLYVNYEYHNFNFEALFEYIGKNCGDPSCRYETNAYKAIREKSDEILRVERPKNISIKTSKREVKSIRMNFKKKHFLRENDYVIRIPYKIAHIFKAIVEIVNELQKEGCIINDDTLKNLKESSYGEAFYCTQIKTYDEMYDAIETRNEIAGRCGAQLELYNDFHSTGSVFNLLFK